MLLLLRITALIHAVAVFLQPVLAGSYLSGSVGAIQGHGVIGSGLVLVALVQLLAATIYWRRGGPGWPALATALIIAAETLQIVMGFNRAFTLHVPLGVGLLLACTAFAIWTFQPAAQFSRRAAV
ncbi:hypothetical protein OG394_32870 [Kribbella sp. NBC_01245]|uniref:hypothetical protein n=1 Tax=Kribbella sp. NBC_01245 TaxID=2903578 RepID=UPI002E2DA65D|nr:hypothetical protein [Kribbella sp. NBC_01245]